MTATNINNEVKESNPQTKSFLITFTNKKATAEDKYVSVYSADNIFNGITGSMIPGIFINTNSDAELTKETFVVEVSE